MIFKGKVYDYLKFLAQIVLPAVATLYFALAGIWGLPNAEQVMGSIIAVDTFLGVLLGLSQLQYNNVKYAGDLVVEDTPNGGTTFRLELHQSVDDLERLHEQDEVLFKVRTSQ